MPARSTARMSQVTVTLPGWFSSRRCAALERPVARRCGRDLSAPRARRRLPAWSTASWSILTLSASSRRAGPDRHRHELPKRCTLYRHSAAHLLAAAVTNLFPGAQCGIGPATDEGFFYDFVVRAPVRARGSRRDREEDEGDGARRISSTSARCGRATKPTRSSRGRGEPLKVQLIEEKTEGQTRSLLLHDQGQATPSSTSASARTCRRPAS